jgi:hypothetical protein
MGSDPGNRIRSAPGFRAEPAALKPSRTGLPAVEPEGYTAAAMPPTLARRFHQVGPENVRRTDVHRVCSKWAVGTIWSVGLDGRWRSPCGHVAHPLRAKWLGHWPGAAFAACLAMHLAIIPWPDEICGLAR